MLRPVLSELLRYLQVAPFPHLTTVKVSVLGFVSGCEAWFFLEQPEFSWAAWAWVILTGLFAWGVILCQADAFSRYREFKRLRRLLRRYGFRPGIFRLVAASRCQRDAALLARAGQAFRLFVSCWLVLLALALSVSPLHDALPTHAYAVPALVLLGLLGGNLAQHIAAAVLYRKDRLATG